MQIRIMGLEGSVSSRVSIIWLFTAVIASVSEAVQLHTTPNVIAKCGDKVTLTCQASSPRQLDIKSFMWMHKGETLCKYAEGRLTNNTLCEYSPQKTLTLSFTEVMPVHEGEYRCKMRTTAGANESVTSVKIDNCFGSFTSSVNSTHATCVFKDVYPIIYIPWLHGDAEIQPIWADTTNDQYLRQTLISTIQLDSSRNLSHPYRCCLLADTGTITHCQTLKLASSGSMLRLQWMFAMLGILLVKLFT